MNRLQAVDDATFGDLVERAEGLVLVDFTAAWCPPCRLLTPILEQLADEYGPRARIVGLDADDNQATAARFGVRGLPTLLYFRDGTLVDRTVGLLPKAALRARIEANLAAPAPAGVDARTP